MRLWRRIKVGSKHFLLLSVQPLIVRPTCQLSSRMMTNAVTVGTRQITFMYTVESKLPSILTRQRHLPTEDKCGIKVKRGLATIWRHRHLSRNSFLKEKPLVKYFLNGFLNMFLLSIFFTANLTSLTIKLWRSSNFIYFLILSSDNAGHANLPNRLLLFLWPCSFPVRDGPFSTLSTLFPGATTAAAAAALA